MRTVKLIVYLGAALSWSTVYSQTQTSDNTDTQAAASSSPVAYVYVAHTPKNSSTNEIVAYAAAANGSLSAVSGSPFRENVLSMAVNGKYLMAASNSAPDINAYTIESDGALRYAASTNYAADNGGADDCGVAGQVSFDHTGASLYVQEYDATSACTNDILASFQVNKSTGGLKYLGLSSTGTFPGIVTAAHFIGNDLYAYAADDSACMYYQIYGFKRSSNGNLVQIANVQKNSPTPPPGASAFAPNLTAVDATNHVAVAMQPANPPGCAVGPIQLATYTADSSGYLTTTSTASNMPVSKVSGVYDMKTSPSGKLLAVAGTEGLQIFHFNGASPITHYTNLLTSDQISQMFWDNSNNLYAISNSAGKLFVYTITPTGYKEAPGSPHSIASPYSVIVQPLVK